MAWVGVVVFACLTCVVLGGTCPHSGWKYRDGICYQIYEEPKTR